jgi:glycosyltransferase involved in cell wall biosynthesis
MRGWKRVVAERGRPDMTHVHIMVRPALIAWWASWWHSIPFLISEQSSQYLDGGYARKGALAKAIHHFLFRRARRVTAVSAHLGDALVKHGLCLRCEVVPNVVPGTDRPLPLRGPAGSFMVVADLVDRTKNVSGVLRALAAVRHQRPELRLEVIGDGVDAAALRDLSHQLGLNGSVRFLGRMSQPEVLDHMAHTGAVVVNSNVETFSVVTGEALALGRPVIATRCGGPESFITKDNGVLIDTKDDASLGRAMLDLVANADRYDPALIRGTVERSLQQRSGGSGLHEHLPGGAHAWSPLSRPPAPPQHGCASASYATGPCSNAGRRRACVRCWPCPAWNSPWWWRTIARRPGRDRSLSASCATPGGWRFTSSTAAAGSNRARWNVWT